MAKLLINKTGGAAEAAEISALALPDMPVYSVNEAEAIGRVKEVIIDPDAKCLLALAVDKGGWYHDVRMIPAGKISILGDDAVMLDERRVTVPPPDLPKIVQNIKHPCNIIGARLVSEDGRVFGRAENFYISRENGKISRIEIYGGLLGRLWAGKITLDAAHILTVGTDTVVVDAAAAADLQPEAGVLKVNFKAVADMAGQGAQNFGSLRHKTRQRLKEIAAARRESPAAGEVADNAAGVANL